MPPYQQGTASLPLVGMRRGDLPVAVFNNEAVLAGEFSQALNIGIAASLLESGAGGEFIRVSGVFAGAPGTFAIQIQTADQDAPASYVSENFGGASPGVLSTVNANNAFSVELEPVVARFIRAYVVSLQNAVNLTLTIMRG